jgi:hypothetical protein
MPTLNRIHSNRSIMSIIINDINQKIKKKKIKFKIKFKQKNKDYFFLFLKLYILNWLVYYFPK